MKAKLYDWRPEDDLKTPEAQAEFITAALEENDPAFIAQSLAVVARAKGKPKIAAVMDGMAAVIAAAGESAPRMAKCAAEAKPRQKTASGAMRLKGPQGAARKTRRREFAMA